jgi:hypothetical protein
MKTSIYLLIPALLLTIAFAQAPPPPELKDPFLDNFVGDWRVERERLDHNWPCHRIPYSCRDSMRLSGVLVNSSLEPGEIGAVICNH